MKFFKLLLLISCSSSWASEIDSFYQRYSVLSGKTGNYFGKPISNSLPASDIVVNKYLELAIKEANRYIKNKNTPAKSCHDKSAKNILYRRIYSRLSLPLEFGERFRKEIVKNHTEVYRMNVDQSIYQDFKPSESISLAAISKWFFDTLGKLYRMDLENLIMDNATFKIVDNKIILSNSEQTIEYNITGPIEPDFTYIPINNTEFLKIVGNKIIKVTPIVIGTDKFSHFFSRSMKIFKAIYIKRELKTPKEIAEYNLESELSLFGMKSTGLASFGDLVTNFQGARFWNNLIGEYLDGEKSVDLITGEKIDPYIICDNDGNWKKVKDFTFKKYMDLGWDEAYNCSVFRNERLAQVTRYRIYLMQLQDPNNQYSCPLNLPEMIKLRDSYGADYQDFFNLDGMIDWKNKKELMNRFNDNQSKIDEHRMFINQLLQNESTVFKSFKP